MTRLTIYTLIGIFLTPVGLIPLATMEIGAILVFFSLREM